MNALVSVLCVGVLLAPIAAPPPPMARTRPALAKQLTPDARIVMTGVDFTGMTATLAPTANKPLFDLAGILKASPETRIRIEAFVDQTDPNADALSQSRAETVKARLIGLGAPAATLEAKGMGGQEPLVPSIVAAMKVKNRRVQLRVLVAPGGARPAVAVATSRSTPAPTVATPVVPAATPAPTPARTAVAAAAPVASPAAAGTKVTVVSTGKTSKLAPSLLAGLLKKAGADVVRIAQVKESRPATVVYFTPQFRAEAQRLESAGALPRGTTLVAVKKIDPQTSVMIVLGSESRK